MIRYLALVIASAAMVSCTCPKQACCGKDGKCCKPAAGASCCGKDGKCCKEGHKH